MTQLRLSLKGAALAALFFIQAARAAAPLTWDAAFDTSKAASRVHAQVRYLDANGSAHTLELWRDGADRLRRKTDDRIDLYAVRGADRELHYTMLDMHRRIAVDVKRTNLYRIGVFNDWAGLAHLLKRPEGPVKIATLSNTAPQAAALAPIDACTWRRIAPAVPRANGRVVCWSTRYGLPLVIARDDETTPLLRVERVESFERDDALFAPALDGYTRVDADQDIDPAGD